MFTCQKIHSKKGKKGEKEETVEPGQKVIQEDVDLINKHLQCESKFIPSSIFSFGIKLRLEGDIHAMADVMKWSRMRASELAGFDLSVDVNSTEKDDIRTAEKCLLQSKDHLNVELDQLNG